METSQSENSLACLELTSIAAGYRALAWITSNVESARILDASPVGPGFMILMMGAHDAFAGLASGLRPALEVDSTKSVWRDFVVVDRNAAVLAEALFALPRVDLAEALIVAECESVSALLSVAELLTSSYETRAIELRILRSSTGGAYGFFTGSAKACAPAVETVRTRLRDSVRAGRLELIENPAEGFRAFFNLGGV